MCSHACSRLRQLANTGELASAEGSDASSSGNEKGPKINLNINLNTDINILVVPFFGVRAPKKDRSYLNLVPFSLSITNISNSSSFLILSLIFSSLLLQVLYSLLLLLLF